MHRFSEQPIPSFNRADRVGYQIQDHGHRPLDLRVRWEEDLAATTAVQWIAVGALDVSGDRVSLVAQPLVLIGGSLLFFFANLATSPLADINIGFPA